MDTALIGRDAELARLRALVDPPPAEGRVLILLGDAGMGKTVLLADAAEQARRAGLRVLSVTGIESEHDLAFAGLHQLLRPVLGRVEELPDRQAKALLGALALSPDPVSPDALLTGIAVLTLLSDLSEDGPLLVLADDVQWLDRGSLGTLAFVARRLEAEPVALLLAARGTVPPAGFGRDFPELTLEPLSTRDAARLLDAQPQSPRGRAREQVLTQAAGNPMALIELSRVIAADPAAGRRWAAEPLPPTERLAAIIAAEFDKLPGHARDALLLAAVADTADLTALGMPALTADALAPAEAAELIRVDTSGPHFNHPLVRSAIYHAVPFAERAAAHRRIAEALRDQPDRYAWHLAAAALGPDERVASLLEETAAQAQRRGGLAAAARALERAAELSPREYDQARRLLAASDLALPTGQADWVQELATKVLSVTADPELRNRARLRAGWALVWSNRYAVLSWLQAAGVRGRSGAALSVLQWACIDSGRWDEALAAAREAGEVATEYLTETVAASADLAAATVFAMRGDYDQVEPHLASALVAVNPAEYRAYAARARHAAGLAALGDGGYVTAYAQLSQLFDGEGTPLHHHVSYLGIADFAAAAIRTERVLEARTVIERAMARVDPAPGPRLEQLAARARGMAAEPADAGDHFERALSHPAGEAWPFERAQLQLDYGEWLRRQRRINQAKPVLAAALETFRRLDAAPWVRRTEAELRACGVTAQAAPTVPGALAELTPQQREIVILASQGLTNGEIADRLFLSPRTVASHLYRAYPKLGIAGRHQLRDLVDRART